MTIYITKVCFNYISAPNDAFPLAINANTTTLTLSH